MALFEPIFEALSRGGGRYVVVGRPRDLEDVERLREIE
jgi:hypothetical protein